MSSNIITINGQHYDAKTGQLLSAGDHVAVQKQNGVAIDGFSRRSSVDKHIAPAHKVHSKTERSKTLMRTAVKKPTYSTVHGTNHNKAHHTKPPKHEVSLANHERALRATHVPKSSQISRFGSSLVAQNSPGHSTHKSVTHVPVKKAPPISEHHAAPIVSSFPNPFATAIDNATSHQEPKTKKATKRQKIASKLRISPRTLSIGGFVAAGFLLSGFFIYQNIPNLAMRVAAARSGVSASLPDYKPAGFALNGPIKYSAGKISINYRSTTDERNYAVTQSNSEWNDEALLDNFVTSEHRPYQTYQDNGKTIYIYDDDNATWINNGVWYQVEGKSSLNSDQLLRIANSL